MWVIKYFILCNVKFCLKYILASQIVAKYTRVAIRMTEEPLNNKSEILQRSDDTADSQSLNPIQSAINFVENATAERLDSAMAAAEYGWFHVCLWAVCGGAYVSAALVPNILSYHSSSVECDLLLSHSDKIIVNYVTYAGTLSGMLMCGVVSDLVGRRLPLTLCLLLNSVSVFALSLAARLPWFAVCRFLSSFSSSGCIAMALTYLAELQTSGTRGIAISSMQIFWVLGSLSLTALSLRWQTLSAIAGILPLLLGILVLIVLPESPRYLLSKGRREAVLKSVHVMFVLNTKLDKELFPVKVVLDNESVDEIKERIENDKLIPRYLKPERFCFLVLLLSEFAFIFGLHSLSLRVSRVLTCYEHMFHDTHDSSNCLLDGHPTRQQHHTIMTLVYPAGELPPWTTCTPGSNPKHLHTMMLLLAAAAVQAVVFLAYNIDHHGRKIFLVLSHVTAGYLTFLWFLARDVTFSLALAAIYQAVSCLAAASRQCLAVEIVSTKYRATYIACLLGVGRLGFMLADFTYFWNFNVTCIGLEIFIATIFILTGMLILCLPNTVGVPLR